MPLFIYLFLFAELGMSKLNTYSCVSFNPLWICFCSNFSLAIKLSRCQYVIKHNSSRTTQAASYFLKCVRM